MSEQEVKAHPSPPKGRDVKMHKNHLETVPVIFDLKIFIF
jgi:hypothetical protein